MCLEVNSLSSMIKKKFPFKERNMVKESMMPATNVVVESEVANSNSRGGSQEIDVPTSKSSPTEGILPPHLSEQNVKK
jgi:hypothetical protein